MTFLWQEEHLAALLLIPFVPLSEDLFRMWSAVMPGLGAAAVQPVEFVLGFGASPTNSA